MAIEAPNSKEHAGTPHGKGKNDGGFVTVECLLLFDTDEDKKKVLGLNKSQILQVSIVFCEGDNQASRVRTTRSETCGACSGG